ncbi:MAG: bifunctional oligoribonuclease/PAP phosphatase NrnA [Planctomycetes bacterium]|nr:bifunctional oligoribonuclease/PAP phosphatase NrnA [Planctomycetota bacterium]
MNDRYESNATLDEIATRLRSSRRVILTTHAKPDGDALGSSLALGLVLDQLGIETQIWYMPPVPAMFKPLLAGMDVRLADGSHLPDPDYDDLVVVLDTGAVPQLSHIYPWLETRTDHIIVLDHHIEGDVGVADMRYVDRTAAATAEIVADLIDCLGDGPDRRTAEALFLGIASDTGWFRYSNVTPRTFEHAARLLRAGVDHYAIHDMSDQQHQKSRLDLMGRALASLELALDGRLAIMQLTQDDYRESGASIEDGHGFSELPQQIGTVKVSCLMAQNRSDHVKFSLRSKAGADAIDVNELAKRFKGGGHALAAGARFQGTLDEAKLALIQEVAQILGTD